jgi:hypothetical protein
MAVQARTSTLHSHTSTNPLPYVRVSSITIQTFIKNTPNPAMDGINEADRLFSGKCDNLMNEIDVSTPS